jgi:hypothetical protein
MLPCILVLSLLQARTSLKSTARSHCGILGGMRHRLTRWASPHSAFHVKQEFTASIGKQLVIIVDQMYCVI